MANIFARNVQMKNRGNKQINQQQTDQYQKSLHPVQQKEKTIQERLDEYMKSLNVVVVDCGRYTTKFQTGNGYTNSFPSRVTKAEGGHLNEYSADDGGTRSTGSLTIKYRGNYYHIGDKAEMEDPNKRSNFDTKVSEESVLLSLAACWLGGMEDKEITLVFGLPIMKDEKEYKKHVQGLTKYLKRKHTIEISGKKYTFDIKEILFPFEAASAFYSIWATEDHQKITGKDIAIVDVGAATSHVALYEFKSGNHFLNSRKTFVFDEGYDHNDSKPMSKLVDALYQKMSQDGFPLTGNERESSNMLIYTVGHAHELLAKELNQVINKKETKNEDVKEIPVESALKGAQANAHGFRVKSMADLYKRKKAELETEKRRGQ